MLGTGEKMDGLEVFHPDRIASRILDMGDVLSLVERAAENIDREEAEAVAKKMMAGKFDLDDYVAQLNQMSKMGGMGGIMGMLPGMGKMKDAIANAGIDDSVFTYQKAIISSMTKKERKNPKLLNANRRKRIANGSGTSVQQVNQLMKQFTQMETMMKRLKKMGGMGALMQGMKGGMGNLFGGGGGMMQ